MTKIAVMLALVLPVAAGAQEVFKCKGADGSVTFSQHPCGDGAEAVQIRTYEPSAEERARAAARARPSALSLDGDLRICLDRAQRVAAPVFRQIEANWARIRQLEHRSRQAANNLAGATWEAGLRQEIASLHQANATLQTSADEQVRQAENACYQERERQARALEEAERREAERLQGQPQG